MRTTPLLKSVAIPILCAGILAAGGCSSLPALKPAPVRTDETLHAVKHGMPKDEVLRLVGPPDETMKFPSGNLSWDYLYQDTWGFNTRYSVTFNPEGRVVDTVAVRLNDGGRDGRDK
jgi:outer membrane protein assembly factor BamE (lipoprotein component of BamABCDE complex)